MTSYSSQSKRSVGFGDYWWFILSLIPTIHWLPLTLAGTKTKKNKWIFWGLLYFSIMVLAFVLKMFDFLSFAFFVSWIVSIFHTFSIKKEYLYYLSQIPEKFSKTITFDKRTGKHITHFSRNLGKHARIIANIETLQNQIENQLRKTKDNVITDELKPIINKYVTQTKELAEKDSKLEEILKSFNTKEIDFKIRELNRKIDRTDNAELMQQYMETINNLEHSKKMYNDFQDQREIIRLKLDGAQMDLKKIKMNLINMQDLSSQDRNMAYVKDFETKSQELNTYLELLKDYKKI